VLSTNEIMIDRLTEEVRAIYKRDYGLLNPEYPNIACWAVRMAIENIRNSDALYHNVEHTAFVLEVGLRIISGRQIRDGDVTPHDWLMYTVALAFHDIGYVRGACAGDRPGVYMTGIGDECVVLGSTVTDASMSPYHVDRAKMFIRDRFAGNALLDVEQICRNIEHTRFPVPEGEDYACNRDFPGLVRAADLIGQLADPRYLMKLPALFYEFYETGAHKKLGYKNPDDVRRRYPVFFWNTVRPYITEALEYLRLTEAGYQWVANLHSVIFDAQQER